MGIKLIFLGLWTPRYVISRELDKVTAITNNALREALKTYAPDAPDEIAQKEPPPRSVEAKRSKMANEHKVLVESLIKALGKEKAVKIGREALFKAGEKLGTETRLRLGVGNSRGDLVKAARILYRVLGINFRVEWQDETHSNLVVDRCDLAKDYSELTCTVLSATDEGVVKGLNPNMNMKFERWLTSGCSNCIARISQNEGDN
jgi:hypothetical protein